MTPKDIENQIDILLEAASSLNTHELRTGQDWKIARNIFAGTSFLQYAKAQFNLAHEQWEQNK